MNGRYWHRTGMVAAGLSLAFFVTACAHAPAKQSARHAPDESSIRRAQESGTAVISGRVTDKNGEPLRYANVIIMGKSMGANADASGRYLIRNVPAGVFTLKAMRLGYTPKAQDSVRVEEGQTLQLNFELSESPLRMKITDALGGR